eukprot:gb/GEZN01010975.1/.p1 GENE.gb/GEZN01010975.1/~~gb/GEZN01010975.1/.p1  ORF type:complete len:206 (-),score=41.22 gb/GEZN01010975.1/:466-1083(-)
MASTGDSNVDTSIHTAQKLKEEGNEFFKAKEFRKALSKYTKIFAWVNYLDVPSELREMTSSSNRAPVDAAVATQARELRMAANTNCAACHLRLNQLDKANDFIKRGLELDAKNERCRLIRGQIALRTGNLELAREDLESVERKFATIVAKEMRDLKEKEKQSKKKETEFWKKAFSKQTTGSCETTGNGDSETTMEAERSAENAEG